MILKLLGQSIIEVIDKAANGQIKFMKIKKFVWLFIILIVVVGWAMGQYDYNRLVDGKPPIFARIRLELKDGGTGQYLGFGYTVNQMHQMRWGIEIQNDVTGTAAYKAAPYAPYRVGPTLDYWTPFVSREHTMFIVETNK